MFSIVSVLCIPQNSPMPDQHEAQETAPKGQRQSRLSKDGQWLSFPKVPNLLQYVSSGAYYARVKVNGKLIRRSLDTDVFTTAKLKLLDFLKERKQERESVAVFTFAEAQLLYERRLDSDPTVKPQSRQYRRWCIRKLELSWPQLKGLRLNEITAEACRDWGAKLSQDIAAQYYNNTIATLRLIIQAAIDELRRQGADRLENPAAALPRVRIKQNELKLPEPEAFRQLVANVAKGSGGWGSRDATLIEFLAYGGMRAFSEAQWVAWEDVDWKRKEIIVRGSPETGTKNSEVRRIPMIPDMEALLNRLKITYSPSGRILEVRKWQRALTRACTELGIPRITHHDLRHLFATRCIESGVDIPTVARWMGHKDGGALAMRVYGHLRNQHSQEMARKVKF